tara:strand:- start:479 stop:1516 length:1038 start_codon:yes stop_codon:yes gene_type:complete
MKIKIISFFNLFFTLFFFNSAFGLDPPNHSVKAKILFNEIYDINISEGNYKVSAELLLSWDGDINPFLKKFKDNIIHGEKLENFLKEIWHPEFLIFNAENPRTTHYKTLNVFEGKFQLFERFDSVLSIDADMPYYPFGDLNLNMDILAFSGNVNLMEFIPEEILVGHDDNEDLNRRVIKGNWLLDEKKIKSSQMQSLNHGGEKFSVLISNVNVKHKFMNSLLIILFPVFSIVILSLIINNYCPMKYDGSADWRIGGQMTLFLIIPALKFALSSELPVTDYLNFTDLIFVWATLIVSFGLILGILSNYYILSNDTNLLGLSESLAQKFLPIATIFTFSVILFYVFT